MLLEQISGGFARGALYGLLALAIVLIFRVSQVANFAQGEMAMLATFVAYETFTAGLPLWLAMIVALLFAALLGAAVYLLVVWPMRKADRCRRRSPRSDLQIVMNAVAVRLWANNQPYRFPPIFQTATLRLGGLSLPHRSSLLVLLAYAAACRRALVVLPLHPRRDWSFVRSRRTDRCAALRHPGGLGRRLRLDDQFHDRRRCGHAVRARRFSWPPS